MEEHERDAELQRKFMQEQMEMLIKLVADQLKSKIPEKETVTVEHDTEFRKLTETDDYVQGSGQERNVPSRGGGRSSPKQCGYSKI